MSLNLNDRLPTAPSAYSDSPAFSDAVNDSRLVRTFGILALAASILSLFIGGFVGAGVGLAIMAFGGTLYYRVLGIIIALLSVISIFSLPLLSLRFVASMVLGAGIALRGLRILSTLAAEGKGDPDWLATRNRALMGAILSTIGFVISTILLALFLLGLALMKS